MTSSIAVRGTAANVTILQPASGTASLLTSVLGHPSYKIIAQKHGTAGRAVITISENMLTKSEYVIPNNYFYYLLVTSIAIAMAGSVMDKSALCKELLKHQSRTRCSYSH